jgi:hypothetical protein
VKEYQQNYLEHILRMPTHLLFRKLFDYHPSFRKHVERGRPPKRRKDHFVLPEDWNRLEGLNLAVDDSGGGDEIVGS